MEEPRHAFGGHSILRFKGCVGKCAGALEAKEPPCTFNAVRDGAPREIKPVKCCQRLFDFSEAPKTLLKLRYSATRAAIKLAFVTNHDDCR